MRQSRNDRPCMELNVHYRKTPIPELGARSEPGGTR